MIDNYAEKSIQTSEPVQRTVVRFGLYTLSVLLIAKSLPLLALHGDAAAFKDNGLVEWTQLALLAAVSILHFREASLTPQYRQLSIILASLAAFAAFREMDANLDSLLPWVGWKIGYLFIVVLGVVAYSHRKVLDRQIAHLHHSGAMLLLWVGFMIAIPFAQLVGNKAFLLAIMGEDYVRDYQRMIEELGELMGYFFLLVGSLEFIRSNRAS